MDMPVDVARALDDLESGDRLAQGEVYATLQAASLAAGDWGPLVWDRLVVLLGHKDNRVRAIAGQALCWLARSIPAELALRDLAAIFAVTRDEKFVTARHVLQALWQVGRPPTLRAPVIDGLAARYRNCVDEKNATLLRYDILCGLRRLFDATGDLRAKDISMQMIPLEADLKYRKKYQTVWSGT
ncbi:MAG: hypothetical protein ABI832_00710 [bacterium]